MLCKQCGVTMEYDFQFDDAEWARAWNESGVPRPDGVLCAHCCLNNLGLRVWKIEASS